MQTSLHGDTVGTRGGPEVVTLAPVMLWGAEAGNLPPGDTPAIDNGISFDEMMMPRGEERSRILPKLGSGRFCEQCPELSSFATKGALRKHRREAHASSLPRCPMCSATVSKQPLARHLKRIHGITDTVVETTPLPVSTPMRIGDAAELLHGSHGSDGTTASKTNETESERAYCQEYDCGRGFSSKPYLESHMRYFHSRRPQQIADEQETSPSSEGVVERPTEPRPLETPTSMGTLTHEKERPDDRDPRPTVGTGVPNFGGGYQGTDPEAENAVKRSEIVVKSSPSIQGSVDPRFKTAPHSADILPLHCRICYAPPTLTTQPTVTTCGHLFCFGCITQRVSSTSRCSVCNCPLLLYCLFKLDLTS